MNALHRLYTRKHIFRSISSAPTQKQQTEHLHSVSIFLSPSTISPHTLTTWSTSASIHMLRLRATRPPRDPGHAPSHSLHPESFIHFPVHHRRSHRPYRRSRGVSPWPQNLQRNLVWVRIPWRHMPVICPCCEVLHNRRLRRC